MRDPNRIAKFCDRLAEAWRTNPDLRFGQFVLNALGSIQAEKRRDVFYIEDDEMIEAIEAYANKCGNSPWKKRG